MPINDYNPTPLAPGDLPQVMRICEYLFKNGDTCLAVICSVGERHEAESAEYGPWYDVGANIFPHGRTDRVCKDLRDGWRYFPKTAKIYWCPCGEPNPAKPCPPG